MLTIRAQQVEALQTAACERLARETLRWLRFEAPHSVGGLSEDELQQRMAAAIRKGNRYGFRTNRDWRAFVRLVFEIGPNFDRYPPFRALLSSPDVPPGFQLPALFQYATDREWMRAAVFDIVSRSRQTLSTDVRNIRPVQLEPLAPCHADSYYRLSSHPDVWRLANLTPMRSAIEAEQYILALPAEARKGYAITDFAHGFAGAIILEHLGATRLLYWIGRPYWGQGVATGAVRQLLAMLADSCEIIAVSHPGNVASRRVLEKCGFVQQGAEPDDGEVTYRYPAAAFAQGAGHG